MNGRRRTARRDAMGFGYDAGEQRRQVARLTMYAMTGGISWAQSRALRGKIRNLAAATGMARAAIEAQAHADAQILIHENL